MVDFQEFINIMNDSFAVSDEAIIKEIQELFLHYDPVLLAASFAGLITYPELQSNAFRLEALIHFSLQYAKGNKKPKKQVVEKAFKLFSKSSLSHQEDPAEDVFVSLVNFQGQSFLIFEGLWEGNAFHLQRFLDVIEDMPDENWFLELKKCVWALLILSDVTIKRKGLTRYTLGNQERLSEIPTTLVENFSSLNNSVKFSNHDLRELGIKIDDVFYFLFNIEHTSNLSKQILGETDLEKQPLVYNGHEIYILLPSAIGIAIRRLAIDKVASIDQLGVLEKLIANSYGRLFNDLHILGNLPNCSLNFFRNEKMHLLTAEALIDIDNGRPLHLIFLVDDFSNRESGWINSSNSYAKEIGTELSNNILRTKQFVKNIPNYKEGVTLIVGCGWGRNFGFDFPTGEDEDWKIEVILAYDLAMFSLSPGMEALTFYRLLEAREKIESENVELMNLNGLLNLYGWAQELDYHLVPHEQMQDAAPYESRLIVPISQNSLLKIRQEAYLAWDEHIKVNPKGEPVHVIKKGGISYFEEDTFKPLYFSKDDFRKHQLRAIYEGTYFDVWCSLYTAQSSDNALTFQIFDAACNWLHRAVQVLELILPLLPEKQIIWNLNFDELILANDYPEAISYKELQNLIVIDCSQKNLDVTFKKRFIDGFAGKENLAEKCMVWSLVKGICVIAKNNFSDEQIEMIVDQIVTDSEAKSLHLFSAQTFFDYVQNTLPKAIVINRFDDATMRIGLGWLVQNPENGNQIAGIKNCTKFLNDLIDRIWEKTKALLVTLNREQLIEKLLLNLEAIRKENRRWNNTIKAVLAQHDDKSNAMEVASRKLTELNGASLSSRLVIEMALCECPIDTGKIAGEIEISKLMAYASMLHHTGGWSDAIDKECMDAEIIISTLGEILFDHSFTDAVISRYGLAVNNKMLNSHAEQYDKLFIISNTVSSVEESFDVQFIEAWNDEYGFTIDECLDFIDHLEDIAVKQNLAVIKLTEVELVPDNVPKTKIQTILQSLVLYPRVSWDYTPDGFKAKDWYPWKFRRRLSLVSRPIVKLDTVNLTYLVAPASIRESFLYLVRGAYEAEFDDKFYSSDKMRKWNGDKRNFYGHDFNKQVANKLSEFGWQTEPDVFITKILNKRFQKDFGDVDVLAWDEVSGRVLAIECKDLLFAKTQGEIANQLSEFRGVGKDDRLKKHLDRIDLLNNNLSAVQKYLGLEKIKSIEIVLVFSNVVPIAYTKNEVLQKINIKLFSELDKL